MKRMMKIMLKICSYSALKEKSHTSNK